MYRIEGDGSYENTKVWDDDVLVKDWRDLTIRIDKDTCLALVTSDSYEPTWKPIKRVVLSGVYMIVSDGDFTNTKVLTNDAPLRGIQSLIATIAKDEHPYIRFVAVMLPNIVETP